MVEIITTGAVGTAISSRPPRVSARVRAMDLTDQRERAIKERAVRTGVVEAVRLYGSRAKGCARPDSDVDLAITTGVGHYVALARGWEDELSKALGLTVHVKQYNCPADDRVRRYCDEYSVVLFSRR